MPGMGELRIVLVIVLLIFGAGKLPKIGDALGRSIRNFKRASGSEGEGEGEVSGKQDRARELEEARVRLRELEAGGEELEHPGLGGQRRTAKREA